MTAELLTAGWQFHQAGDLPRAEQSYRHLLQQEPGNAQAWFLLGVLCQTRGDLSAAAGHLDQALRLRPAFAEALNYRGVVWAQQGEPEEALARFREALRLKPGDAEIQTNLAVALARQERLAEAVALLEPVLQRRPEYTRARHHLHRVRAQQATAEGVAFLDRGILDAAADCFRQALAWRPDFAGAYAYLARVFRQQKRLTEAEACSRAFIRLQPEDPEAHNSLGADLLEQQRPAEAQDCFQRAVLLQPEFAEGHANLGHALLHLGRHEEALTSYARAIQAQPENPSFHWNKGFVCLQLGDLENGLAEFEWRWERPEYRRLVFARPRWDGSPLAGRTILLHVEGGFGDTIQFVRYARLAQEQGATVIVECQRPLLRLLASCPGIDQLVAHGDPLPPHDVQVSFGSLPYYFRTRLPSIPAPIPYLRADPVLVEQWRQELAGLPGFKIGIAWQGSKHADQDGRSLPLAELAPLAAVPGVRLLSLQKGPGSEQLADVAGRWPVTDLGSRLHDFMDTAAVVANLDLLVTADTSVPHVAGALGVPAWVALPKIHCWRWLRDREDSPWYPTTRLFCQEQLGDWGSVFRRIAQAVDGRLRAAGR